MDALSRWEDNQLWAEEKRREGREVSEYCCHCSQVVEWIEGDEENEFVWKCNAHDEDDFTGCRPCFKKHLVDTGY